MIIEQQNGILTLHHKGDGGWSLIRVPEKLAWRIIMKYIIETGESFPLEKRSDLNKNITERQLDDLMQERQWVEFWRQHESGQCALADRWRISAK